MKNLKFIPVAVLLVLFFSESVMSQGLGIRAGVNFQNINGKDALDESLSNDLITGYHVGITGEAGIAPDFYFQSGLLFSVKGSESNEDILGQDFTSKLTLGYLEVPLHLVYKPTVGVGKVILGFGPYVAFGLTGKAKLESSLGDDEVDVSFQNSVGENDSEENYYVRRFDSGANIFFGYEFLGGLFLQLNAQLGLVNISPEYDFIDDDNTKWNNTGFGLSAGFRFGGN